MFSTLPSKQENSDYTKKTVIVIIFILLVIGLGIGIYFIVKIVAESSNNLDRRSLNDLFLGDGRDKNITGDIKLKLKGTSYNFTLSNSIRDFDPNHSQIYYDTYSHNLMLIVPDDTIRLQAPALWTVSYTYAGKDIKYDIYVAGFEATINIKNGANVIKIQNYLITY